MREVGKEYWQFQYSISRVHAGAKAKQKMHAERITWWTKKQAEVVKKIKAKGMDVRESIAAALGTSSNYTNAGKFAPNAQIVIDPTLQQDLSECVGKVQYHKAKEREYHAWTQTLGDQPGKNMLHLTHEDWLYFFGA